MQCLWSHVKHRLQVRKIDNGYLVAWQDHMDYKIAKASSSVISSVLTGEGLVCSFTGVALLQGWHQKAGDFRCDGHSPATWQPRSNSHLSEPWRCTACVHGRSLCR